MSFVRFFIEWITATLGWLKQWRRIDITGASDEVKVNLGCGLAVASGWINVDGSLNALIAGGPSFVHRVLYHLTGANRYYSCQEYCDLLGENRFVHHDLSKGLPFVDDVVDVVYSSHFLEHLYREDAEYLLRESWRVLHSGGRIRVCIPDLAYAVSLYQDQNNKNKVKMLENYFFVQDKASYYAVHKYMYDFDLLRLKLEEAGFINIERCSYQHGQIPDLEKLDNRAEDTLFVEAQKP